MSRKEVVDKESGSLNDSLVQTTDEGKLYHSDNEVPLEELSDDHGEGHGKHGAKATVLGSALNIANTIMGAGILGLPNVISQFGIFLGSGIIVFSCILTFISCNLLLKAKNLSKHSKFITIGKHCFGMKGLWLVKAIIIVNNVGLCIAYLIIFSTVGANLIGGFTDQCGASVASPPFFCSQWILILIASILVLPFVFANSMSKFQKLSAVAVLAAISFSVITVGNYIYQAIHDTAAKDVYFIPHITSAVDALSSVTSVFLAFTFQFNFFPVFKSLENANDSRMKKTTSTGLTLVVVIYLLVANCGYLTFGSANADNFLKNFSRDNLATFAFIIINIAFLISSTFTLPLMFYGAKNEIYGMIKLIRKMHHDNKVQQSGYTQEANDEDDEKAIEAKFGFKGPNFVIYVVTLFACIVLLAIFVPGINTVFQFVGSTAANGLNFLLPTLFYLALSSKRSKLRPVAKFIFVFGAVMGIIAIVCSSIQVAEK